ncbi:MAG TPA: hypothetical protein PK597_00310, partial [Oscillospiraceae bacterium]|nr:hypothetical protein [Oscillospiraceae bacterium]
MDEILRTPVHARAETLAEPADLSETMPFPTEAVLPAPGDVARRSRPLRYALRQLEVALPRLRLGRVFFLLIALAVGAIYIYFNLYYPTYIVTVNGTEIGRVEETGVFESAVARVEAEVSQVLGYDYTLDVQPEYRYTRVLGDQYVSSASFDSYLYSLVTEVEKSYVLKVGGVTVGAASDKAALDAVLNDLLASYTDADTTSAAFVENVSIDYE